MLAAARPSRIVAVLVAACGCTGAFADGRINQSSVALITITSPKSLAKALPGYFATFSILPRAAGTDVTAWVPAGDPEGCQGDLPMAPVADGPVVAVLRRGTCTFVEKAQKAQKAGAAGLVIVSNSETFLAVRDNRTRAELGLSILVVDVLKSDGDEIIRWVGDNPSEQVRMNFAVYSPGIWNLSEGVIILMGTFLVAAGAFFATADMRIGSPLAPTSSEEVVDISSEMALGFCVAGSCMLCVLFFLMKYMIYFIIFAFCVGGFSCIQQITSSVLSYNIPSLKHRTTNIPLIGTVTAGDIVAAIPAIALVLSWLFLRNTHYGWFFQDIIGAGFLCWMQRTLRLPNIKIATLLLSVMFFFDIFWVFISPLLFQKSVMVEVARGGGTGEAVPMLLRVPAIGDPLGNDRMLGFGDIALPGLLVSYLRRHDILSKRRSFDGYFAPCVLGYFVGLCVTIVALMLMRMGQPALLYLVPGTLGTTLVLATCRGEVNHLWDGKPCIDRHGCGASESFTANSELERVA